MPGVNPARWWCAVAVDRDFLAALVSPQRFTVTIGRVCGYIAGGIFCSYMLDRSHTEPDLFKRQSKVGHKGVPGNPTRVPVLGGRRFRLSGTTFVEESPADPASTTRSRNRIPAGQRFRILERDGFRCRYCGHGPPEAKLHVDHVVALAHGGVDDDKNLVTACEECNLGKGARPLRD